MNNDIRVDRASTEGAAVWRFKWLVIAITVATSGIAFGWARVQDPVYSASAQVLVGSVSSAATSGGNVVSSEEVASQRIVATSRAVLEEARTSLPRGVTRGQLARAVSVDPVGDTRVLTFTARSESAREAAVWANAVAEAYIARRVGNLDDKAADSREELAAESEDLSQRLVKVEANLEDPTPKRAPALVTERRLLQTKLGDTAAQLQELAAIDSSEVAELLSPAGQPRSPVEPRPLFLAGVAGLLGLLLGVALAYIAAQVRPRPESNSPETDSPEIDSLGAGS
jgi:uncharacterized protein involved in exopolysaccharide biosynthesis